MQLSSNFFVTDTMGAKPEPYQAMVATMNMIMGEMESLLDERVIRLSSR